MGILQVSFIFLSDETKIPAEPGENVTLPCRTPNNQSAIVVEWIKDDLGEEEFVALYRGTKFDPEGQNPDYENRVDLQDREMKDGNVSLVLMDVTANHTGTYECRVFQKGNKRRKRSIIKGDPICIISLDVAPPPPSGDKDGRKKDGGNKDGRNSAGLIAGVIVGVVIVLALVGGFLLSRKLRRSAEEPNPPARETERVPMNTESGL